MGTAAADLGVGAAVHLVPGAPTWDPDGPLALFAKTFAVYAWIALRRAREATTAGADAAPLDVEYLLRRARL